jgi:hypothetical protein
VMLGWGKAGVSIEMGRTGAIICQPPL